MLPPIENRIADELGVSPGRVAAAVKLLDDGSTVPFIARYRKEATGGLDDAQLRRLEERLVYLRDLEDRRTAVLRSIVEQEKLTPELETAILGAQTKTRLEDLYLPYRPKRRTKAQIAREAGLEPLALALWNDPVRDPDAEAAAYVDPDRGVGDAAAALEGARQILMESFAEDPEFTAEVRDWLWENAQLTSRAVPEKAGDGAKYADYFEHREPIRRVPSHRALALLRGRKEGFLQLRLETGEAPGEPAVPEGIIARRFGIRDQGRAGDAWLRETVRLTWRVKLFPRLDLELETRMRESAEREAIEVFARNLHDLLLAAPAGGRPTLALDPGLRTGVKVAVVDATGKVRDTATIFPHPPRKQWEESIETLRRLCVANAVELVAVGNGTASRETDKLAAELVRRHPELGLVRIMVSEAGASVYSASELASRELPELDVSLRGAVSIGRRLQDPLAELVKIDPKAIGVGQYQHDVSQLQLARSLDNVVEDCVNAVGVDLNTASPALLARVSGLSPSLAESIVAHRDAHGAFRSRRRLLDVSRLGAKTFEQAAGFLRIRDGDDPLDASAVHPEAYPVVERILAANARSLGEALADPAFMQGLDPADYVDGSFGLPTVRDILSELAKPGRDPRPAFTAPAFQEGVETLQDLAPGMVLEGAITNVTNFGAFVDVGVHQDGLVHISAMSDKFVKDPRQLVKAGDVVKVKVMEVDLPRRRIGLSMRLTDEPGEVPERTGRKEPAARDRRGRGGGKARGEDGGRPDRDAGKARKERASGNSALADALTRAGLKDR